MREIIKFREFIAEARSDKNIEEYRVQAIMISSNSTYMNKTEILSNIRSVEGITRVKIENSVNRQNYEISQVTMKIDTYPFKMVPKEEILNKIRREILKIEGIRRFSYIGRIQRI